MEEHGGLNNYQHDVEVHLRYPISYFQEIWDHSIRIISASILCEFLVIAFPK